MKILVILLFTFNLQAFNFIDGSEYTMHGKFVKNKSRIYFIVNEGKKSQTRFLIGITWFNYNVFLNKNIKIKARMIKSKILLISPLRYMGRSFDPSRGIERAR